MKSASRILIIIGAVLSYLSLLGLVITAIVFFVLSGEGAKQMLLDGLRDGTVTSTFSGTTEEQVAQIQELFKILAIVFISLSAFFFISPTVSLVASAKQSKGLHIIGLILSIIGFDIFLILGNAFGLSEEN